MCGLHPRFKHKISTTFHFTKYLLRTLSISGFIIRLIILFLLLAEIIEMLLKYWEFERNRQQLEVNTLNIELAD